MGFLTKTEKILLSISIAVAIVGLATGALSYFFGVRIITTGQAYGFKIGDNREKTFKAAQILLNQNKIVAIHTWPEKEFHRPFKKEEIPQQNTDPRWVMIVDPDWWNNTITITFKNNTLVEIRRDRICCELP